MSDHPTELPLFDAAERETQPTPGGPPEAGPPADAPQGGDGPLRRLMDGNFLQYAAYVIRDRAIPHIDDGLKPVQRRILHSLHENDDGRFTKVANIVGYCMQFHPHGDAASGDAPLNAPSKVRKWRSKVDWL